MKHVHFDIEKDGFAHTGLVNPVQIVQSSPCWEMIRKTIWHARR